jgi:DNA polymerase
MRLPKSFVEAARQVFLNVDPLRLPLLHRMADRIADDPRAWADPLHLDRLLFDRLLREVRHEIHKMHAFVRFRQIAAPAVGGEGEAEIRHVAWFEPTHHILEAVAPFFARRFATMRWAILTPRVCVAWNGRALEFGPGASRAQAPGADAGEALWLAYYRSIFNPARVKVAMMKREMPLRFWKNLPEAATIGHLLSEAPQRQQRMIAAGGASRERRRGRIDRPAVERPPDEATGVVPTRGHGTAAAPPSEAHVGAVEGLAERARAAPATERAHARLPADAVTVTVTCSHAGRPAPSRDAAWPPPAALPPDLGTLRRLAARCRDCPVADATTQTVFGEGDASARVMLVGEQPGDQEDLRGRPFQGPAGQLLRAAMGELGWDESTLYLTNAVKHFHHELRGKRRLHKTPGQQEAQACLHWLEAEIDALRPRAIVALGATAARSLLGVDVSVTVHEGQWFEREDGVPVLVCRHPAAILRADGARQPAMRERWLRSLREAQRFLEAETADASA